MRLPRTLSCRPGRLPVRAQTARAPGGGAVAPVGTGRAAAAPHAGRRQVATVPYGRPATATYTGHLPVLGQDGRQ
ncbi:hypothetical protein ACFYVL_02240 [Streptomyces sp. NPDC004111]|uniref:hypothetical protein n=1 Tax=Streptomyces sp. NPDC004111 TaxID=3364690 RepID=UPI003686B908